MTSRPTMATGDWLLLIVLSVLWGGSFFFAEIAVREIPPLTLALARCGIAAAALFVYVRAMGLIMPRDPALWASLAVLAVFNTVLPFSLIFWSQTHIPSGLAAILNATAPLFSIVLAHLATLDEKLTPARALGVAIGFVGVIIVIGIDALRDLGVNVLAQIASVLAAFFYATAGVYGRRFKAHSPAVISTAVLGLGGVMLVPIVALVEQPWQLPAPSLEATASMFGLAVVSTALGFLIYFRVLARAGASNFQLVAFLIPVSAILLGVGFLGETLEWRHLGGMAAIAAGLAAIDGRPYRFLKRLLRPDTAL